MPIQKKKKKKKKKTPKKKKKTKKKKKKKKYQKTPQNENASELSSGIHKVAKCFILK